ncbi:MAG: hypothetical protein WCK14_02545 [Actinomycetota bacterium]|jgi:glutamine phosphoribosylpyrophosphate amidotransferase
MLALTVDTAKNIAIAVVGVFVIVAIISAKLMASVTKKAIMFLVLGALSLGVFTQRQALESCAKKVKNDVGTTETTCTFFGNDIHINTTLP